MTRRSRREIETQIDQLASEVSPSAAGSEISSKLKEDMRTVLQFRYSRALYVDNETQAQLLCSAYDAGTEQGEVTLADLDEAAADAGLGDGRAA
jgi:hypothetical protein